jgi:Domain of unknown function (DUF4282)
MGEQGQGFFGSLFDVSFSSLVTTRVIKVLYVLSMIIIGLFALFFVVAAFSNSVAGGIIVLLIVAPLAALLYLIYVRVLLELVIVIFRIWETNVELVSLQRGQAAGGSSPAPPPSSPPPPAPETPGPVAGLS